MRYKSVCPQSEAFAQYDDSSLWYFMIHSQGSMGGTALETGIIPSNARSFAPRLCYGPTKKRELPRYLRYLLNSGETASPQYKIASGLAGALEPNVWYKTLDVASLILIQRSFPLASVASLALHRKHLYIFLKVDGFRKSRLICMLGSKP